MLDRASFRRRFRCLAPEEEDSYIAACLRREQALANVAIPNRPPALAKPRLGTRVRDRTKGSRGQEADQLVDFTGFDRPARVRAHVVERPTRSTARGHPRLNKKVWLSVPPDTSSRSRAEEASGVANLKCASVRE
jgi:hypothetical protein